MNQTNGHRKNGNKSNNGKGNLMVKTSAENNTPANQNLIVSEFDQPVVLKQSSIWAKAIAGTIIAVTTFGIIWSAVAKIEQVVSAQGQLKPIAKVKEIQAPPLNGIITEVYVEDGEKVKKDQVLLTLDPRSATAELEGKKRVRQALAQESSFYRALMNNRSPAAVEADIVKLNLPQQIASLARNRVALTAENQLFLAQLNQNPANLNLEQQLRWRASQVELGSRSAAAQLEVGQLQEQLARNQVELADARVQLQTEQQIFSEIEPLVQEGGIARLQFVRQQQQVQTRTAEVDQLVRDQERLKLDIQQAREQLTNTVSLTTKEVLDKIGENQKRIAEIDSQFGKILVDNDRQITDLESQIKQTEVTLQYQELRAPVGGTVFDLKAYPGFVPKSNQAETLVKIVPDDNLIAEVYVTNQDIGFVRENMKVDVRIDTFPYSEFGDIKGKVSYIGSDVLPPDETFKFYRFPVKVKLDSQALEVGDRKISLQPGMSLSANIKIRENRTVLSLFTELFTTKIDSLKEIR